jgi:Putative rRNA methylase
MIEHIPTAYHGKINAVMLNLGYLPGSDKQIITQIDSTIAALSSACELLSPGGIITIIAYPGHEGGQEEADQVKGWCANLNREQYQTTLILSAANNLAAPMLFAVNKRC